MIPMKFAGTWSVYLTQRSTEQQIVISVATKIRKVDVTYKDAPGAVYTLEKVTPGVAIMYLTKGVLLLDHNQPAQIVTAYDKLRKAEALEGQPVKECRQRMQFTFPSNQHLGR